MNDKELNNALEQLAEEVPPMPADFHVRWMNAVRAEAGKEAAPAEEAKTRNRTVSLTRWTRILSVAAAFVFLIGGTLLYRNQKKSLSAPQAVEKKAAAVSSAAVNETAEETAEEAPAAGALPEPEAAEPVMFSAAAYDKGEEDAAYDAAVYDAAAYDEAEVGASCDAAVYEAAAYEAGEDSETEEYEEAAAADVDAGEADRAYSARSAAGAFFADMGDFLLAALPYLAVLAVPAAVALVIRRRHNQKGSRG